MTSKISAPRVSAEAIAVADRQPRRLTEGRKRPGSSRQPEPAATASTPPLDAAPGDSEILMSLSAGTLFNAALVANGLRERGLASRPTFMPSGWTPPDSSLRLKDKTI